MPVAIAKMFGSKMMSSGGKLDARRRAGRYAAGRCRPCDRPCRPGRPRRTPSRSRPRRESRHARAWSRNCSSPSFIEIELTIGLPCTHSQPGLDHLELRRVDHHRDAGDVGLGGDQVEERDHRLHAVEQALVHVDVDDLRAVLDLLAGDDERLGVVAVRDQPAELGRAGDVGALADVDERDVVGERERFESRELQRRGGARWSRRAATCRRRRRRSPRCGRASCHSSRRRR